MSMGDGMCPKCGDRMGIVRAENVTEGAFLKHLSCGTVLVVTAVRGQSFDVRVATPEERGLDEGEK